MKPFLKLSLITALIISFFACNQSGAGVKNLEAKAFSEAISSNANAIILDVRTPSEYQGGFIQGAINIDINNPDFGKKINELDKSKPVMVYCLSGGRSSEAASLLASNGFKTVYQLQGGTLAWKGAGLPLASPQANTEVNSANISVEQFNKMVNSDKIVIVDFNATWCKPCKLIAPILDEIEKENSATVQVIKVDVDENPTISDHFKIQSIPYLQAYKGGKLIWEQIGLVDKPTITKGIGM